MGKDPLGNLIIWFLIDKPNYMVLNRKKKKGRKINYRVLRERAPPVTDQASLRSCLSSVSNFLGWMGSLQLAKCFECNRFLRGREVRGGREKLMEE